ncbi:MAG TPA: cation:proton antiporter [Candidatus Acidoferrales bacterium]|nr:cation:proton antiporter [Candidatus Acidoferrales bacterium]
MGIHGVELVVLLLMILVVAFASVAKRLETPYPIILVIGGLLLSLFPRSPHLELDPDIVFLVILPPLLFSAAYVTSWRDFRYNLGYRPEDYERWSDLSRHLMAVQRATILHLRNQNEINDEAARTLERELDLAEARSSLADPA